MRQIPLGQQNSNLNNDVYLFITKLKGPPQVVGIIHVKNNHCRSKESGFRIQIWSSSTYRHVEISIIPPLHIFFFGGGGYKYL